MTPYCLRNTVHDTCLAHKNGRMKRCGLGSLKKSELGSQWFTTNDDGILCDSLGTPLIHEGAELWKKEVCVEMGSGAGGESGATGESRAEGGARQACRRTRSDRESLPRDMPEEEQPEGWEFGHFEFFEGAK